MPTKKKAQSSKKPIAKKISAKCKKSIHTCTKEEVKAWKDGKKATVSLIELETMLEDAFDATDKIWIDTLTPLIAKLDFISSELTKRVNEYRERDIQVKYTEYDKIKDFIVSHCHWED